VGDVQLDNLKGAMDVSRVIFYLDAPADSLVQLWLDNQSGMIGLSSTLTRVTSAISGLSNAFFGQTQLQARLNAIASYDQSNELFKVGWHGHQPQ
jgi:cyclopropane-fatty-acyl-phospholipid synthase